MLGSQISQWFAEINVYTLSQEEFEALRIFDNEIKIESQEEEKYIMEVVKK